MAAMSHSVCQHRVTSKLIYFCPIQMNTNFYREARRMSVDYVFKDELVDEIMNSFLEDAGSVQKGGDKIGYHFSIYVEPLEGNWKPGDGRYDKDGTWITETSFYSMKFTFPNGFEKWIDHYFDLSHGILYVPCSFHNDPTRRIAQSLRRQYLRDDFAEELSNHFIEVRDNLGNQASFFKE